MNRLKRNIRITIRLSIDEWEKLDKLQRDSGKTTSEWVRDKIRHARAK
jgi:predicted DNA-binding protein